MRMRTTTARCRRKTKAPVRPGLGGADTALDADAVLFPDFLGDFALRLAEGQDPVEGTENHCEGAQCQNYISHAVSLRVCGWCADRTLHKLLLRCNNNLQPTRPRLQRLNAIADVNRLFFFVTRRACAYIFEF